jgi:transcriptional regulator of acetoin/glycerol metabolism
MGLSQRSASSLDAIAGHAEHVYSVAEGATPPLGIQAVSSSWQRSAKKHGLDPLDSKAPRILTSAELKHFREPLDKLISTAQEELDELYKVVREAGYAVLLCDSSGVAVAHCGENARASQFQYWKPGSAGCGPRKWRAQTASAPASPKSGLSPFTEASILGPDTLT